VNAALPHPCPGRGGYSRLIGADDAGTLARLRTLLREVVEPLVAENGGRVFKTTGDGLLAEFPSSVQALRCAIVVQERVRGGELQLRIGAHQGDVVVEGDDLLGDGVNVAARLEALAEAGVICISGRVRGDATGKLPLEVANLGEPELKNIAQRHRVFRVRLGALERPAPGRVGSHVCLSPEERSACDNRTGDRRRHTAGSRGREKGIGRCRGVGVRGARAGVARQ
jgi:class 3 adenylate cyclase